MKIYSKGFSSENIDYIVERKLKAIITTEYAIVTIADDGRSHEELREYLDVLEKNTEYISIFFSPEMLVPDLQYVLQSEQEQMDANVLIQEFKFSFFSLITSLAEQSNNLTRAEVIRLIWQELGNATSTPYSNVDEAEKERLLAQVETTEDNKWINDKFVELVFKYSIYLTCWEKAYGYLSVNHYNIANLGMRISRVECNEGSVAHEKTTSNWFRQLIGNRGNKSDKNIPTNIKEAFAKNVSAEVTYSIEEKIYQSCKIQMDTNADKYRKYFYSSHNVNERDWIKATLYELILFTNCFVYAWNMQFNKEKVIEFLLDETKHVGNIGSMIEGNTTASIEIVLMNTLKANQNLVADKSWIDIKSETVSNIIRSANVLQIYIIPAVLVLLEKNEYKDNIPTVELVETLYKDEEIKAKVHNRAKERKDLLNKKDGGNILGNFHVFASENVNIVQDIDDKNEVKKIIVNRSKSIERNYWTQRKKSLSKFEITGVTVTADGLVEKYLEFLHCQNKILRDSVRNVIDTLIQ